MSALLEFGLHLQEGKFDSKAVSLALFEELELLTGIIQQYFDYTDELYDLDMQHYTEIKDKILFYTMYLFTIDRPCSQSSSTEQYLMSMTHDKIANGVLKQGPFTGLDFAIDVQRVKVYFNLMSSILNAAMIGANKGGAEDYINTWGNLGSIADSKRGSRVGSYTHISTTNAMGALTALDQQNSILNLGTSVTSLIAGLQNMSENFKLWLNFEPSMSQFYGTVQGLFTHDEWITNEYLGLNTYFAGSSFVEVLGLFEQALQMGYLTTTIMLGKLKESVINAEQSAVILPQGISMTKVNDSSELIKDSYKKFDIELRRQGMAIKPSVDESYGRKILDFISDLRDGGYRDDMGMTSRTRLFK